CGGCGAPSPGPPAGPGEGALSQLGLDVRATAEGIASLSGPPATAGYAPGPPVRALGKPRPVGKLILLFIVTFGLYSYFWAYAVHEELKGYTGRGMGGLVALLLWLFVSPVVAFTLPYEVEQAYALGGAASSVRALTGLWIFLPLVGGIVWFVKVQRALNRYWLER
ncbi:MAG TPA: DUF4234 domain-containing protein, partial [Acidimicrobiales bacterium]|nr:DUF4234 domain-containing protein [Acidimicrobiales bacterium]